MVGLRGRSFPADDWSRRTQAGILRFAKHNELGVQLVGEGRAPAASYGRGSSPSRPPPPLPT